MFEPRPGNHDFMIHVLGSIIILCLCWQVRVTAGDIADYFPLHSGNEWNFIDDGSPGASIEGDISMKILQTLIDVGGGIMAKRFQTISDSGNIWTRISGIWTRTAPCSFTGSITRQPMVQSIPCR
jgi:hypothetical protein